MQKKAARLVSHSSLREPRKEIFSNLGWLTVNQLIYYHSALSTYRFRQCREPEYLSSFLSRDNGRGNIIVPNTSLTLAKNSYCFRRSVQWKSLPDHITNCVKISQFKLKLKKWILLNIDQFVET